MRYLFVWSILLAMPAAADNVSPWFGSADQKPFQMAADGTHVAASGLERESHTRPLKLSDCAITGCSIAENAAKVLGTGHVSP